METCSGYGELSNRERRTDFAGYTGFGSVPVRAHPTPSQFPRRRNADDYRGVPANMPAVSVVSTVLNESDDIDGWSRV